jgi:iron complex outermembrane receptor protein
VSTNQKIRGEQLRKISCLFLVVCLLNIGWSWPFSKSRATDNAQSTTKEEQSQPIVTTTPTDSKAEVKGPPRQEAAEVTVIASRLPSAKENINDMASNITYKSKQDLAETQPATFQEAVKDTESAVFFDEVGNGVDSTFSLRGFNDPSAVIFLVDGVRVNDIDNNIAKLPLIPMRDVDSIQIERGSTSSVYGSGAFGGVVNVTTGQPSPKPVSLFGGLEWTSFHGLRFNQGISGTLKDKLTPLGGKLSYYFNGERDDTNGFRNHDAMRLTSFDIKTAYELPDNQGRFYFGLKHIVDAINLPGEITHQQFDDSDLTRCNKPKDGWKFNNTVLQLGADKKFWDDRLTASVMASERWNHRKAITTYSTFTDFVHGFDPYTDSIDANGRDRDLTWQVKYNDSWWKLANESLLGMELRRSNQVSLERYAPGGEIREDLPAEGDKSALYSNLGLFWRETVKICDKVIPYFGMRHDFHWLNTNDMLTPTNNISQRWDKSTLSTGVTVKPFKWVDLFGNYSQGFRVPTLDETIPYAGANQVNLQPESSNSYEVGTRLRYKDFAAYKLSYFLIDVDDEIQWDNLKNQYFNIAQTRRYGLEQRVDVTPIQEVKLYGSYTWTTAYVKSNGGTSSLAEGRALGQIPANRFTLGTMVHPLKRLGEPYDGLRFGLNGTFTGQQHPSNYESSSQAVLNSTGKAGHWIPAYTVWDFIVAYAWRQKEIYFKVNNLLNEQYYSRAFSGTSFGTSIYSAGNYTWVNPGAPREFLIGCKWEFS